MGQMLRKGVVGDSDSLLRLADPRVEVARSNLPLPADAEGGGEGGEGPCGLLYREMEFHSHSFYPSGYTHTEVCILENNWRRQIRGLQRYRILLGLYDLLPIDVIREIASYVVVWEVVVDAQRESRFARGDEDLFRMRVLHSQKAS